MTVSSFQLCLIRVQKNSYKIMDGSPQIPQIKQAKFCVELAEMLKDFLNNPEEPVYLHSSMTPQYPKMKFALPYLRHPVCRPPRSTWQEVRNILIWCSRTIKDWFLEVSDLAVLRKHDHEVSVFQCL